MNSLFNYELDEQKIRLTLHDAELDYSDTSWMEFDNEYPAETVKESVLAQFNFPKINLNINRNVLVPIFFILALGGVSAIMFKFIDFKPNTTTETERALESNSAALNIPQKTDPTPIKKEEPKQMVSAPITETKKDSVIPAPTSSLAVAAPISNTYVPQYVPQKAEQPKQNYTEPVVTQKNVVVPDTTSNSNPTEKTTLTANSNDKPPAHQIMYKNRRKKLVIDQVETIKAPSLLSSQAAPAEEEEELKIKPN